MLKLVSQNKNLRWLLNTFFSFFSSFGKSNICLQLYQKKALMCLIETQLQLCVSCHLKLVAFSSDFDFPRISRTSVFITVPAPNGDMNVEDYRAAKKI